MKDHLGCPVQAAINVLSGKWKVQILWRLSFGQMRFAELRRKMRKISEKVLADQLRQLEADGVIQRHASASVPPAVTYSLNTEGQKLVPIMETLCEWGSIHFQMKPNLPGGQRFEVRLKGTRRSSTRRQTPHSIFEKQPRRLTRSSRRSKSRQTSIRPRISLLLSVF